MRRALDGSRLLSPRRAPGDHALRKHYRAEDLPGEFWERLSTLGHIPHEWVGGDQRAFVERCPACGALGFISVPGKQPERCPLCKGQCMVFSEHPSYGLAVMLALDVSGVLACEALAIELCARLRQCGAGEIDAKIHWLQGVETPQVAVRQWTMLGRIPHPPFAGYARTSFEEAVRGDVKSAETLQFKADVFDVLFRLYELGYGLDTVRRSGPVLFAVR